MKLQKIKSKDLIFSGDLEDDRTNTYLVLNDYDWMSYKLSTRFRTKAMGLLNVEFEYFGSGKSQMKVKRQMDITIQEITYEFPTKIFQKHIINFLQKHIASWGSRYAFNGEQEVIDFYNDVLEHGTLIITRYADHITDGPARA